MAVAQRVPLAEPDDRAQGVVLEEQDAAGATRRPLGQRRGLVGAVHQPEAVEHDLGLRRVADHRRPARPAVPATSRRGCRTRRPAGSPAASRPPPPGRRRRRPARPGRPARRPGSLGHRGVDQQLRQPAGGAQPHLQRVGGVGTGIAGGREVVRRGLLAQIEHDLLGAAGPAAMGVGHGIALSSGPAMMAGCRCGRLRWRVCSCSHLPPPRPPGLLHARSTPRWRQCMASTPPFVQDSRSLGPRHAARPPHPGRAGRGEAGPLRLRCDPRRRGRRPAGVADVRPPRGLPPRRRAVPARLHPFWPAPASRS